MGIMGRVKDAWNTLMGRQTVQIRAHAKLARIEAEWLEICAAIESMIETWNHAADRLRQREKRVAKATSKAESAGPPPAAPDVANVIPLTGRAAVIADLQARGKWGVPAPIPTPDKPNGGQRGAS